MYNWTRSAEAKARIRRAQQSVEAIITDSKRPVPAMESVMPVVSVSDISNSDPIDGKIKAYIDQKFEALAWEVKALIHQEVQKLYPETVKPPNLPDLPNTPNLTSVTYIPIINEEKQDPSGNKTIVKGNKVNCTVTLTQDLRQCHIYPFGSSADKYPLEANKLNIQYTEYSEVEEKFKSSKKIEGSVSVIGDRQCITLKEAVGLSYTNKSNIVICN